MCVCVCAEGAVWYLPISKATYPDVGPTLEPVGSLVNKKTNIAETAIKMACGELKTKSKVNNACMLLFSLVLLCMCVYLNVAEF